MTVKNFDATLKTLKGDDLLSNGQPVRQCEAVADALLSPHADEAASGDSKAARYELAMRVVKGGDLDLTVNELKTIRDQVGKTCIALVVGQIYQVLDG